jgi:hypothetical protein
MLTDGDARGAVRTRLLAELPVIGLEICQIRAGSVVAPLIDPVVGEMIP